MYQSKVLKILRGGGVVCSIKVNSSDPRIVEMAAISGVDCVWTDMEHCPNDYSVIEAQVWAAKAHNTDIVIRVERGAYSSYIRPLEADATGIMVPHVMNGNDARNIVRMTRFHPIGLRAIEGGNADGNYTIMQGSEYIKQANTERFVILQIEDPCAMEHLDDIASVEGFDMLFFGPSDYCHALGYPFELDHPEVLKARKLVAEAALKHGKFAGTVGNINNAKEYMELGYQFINLGSDVSSLRVSFSGMINGFRSL